MNKYYVIEIAEGDKKIAGKAIYEYDSQRKALASFHSKLGTAMNSDLYTKELIVVVDMFGVVHAKQSYTAVVETTAE